MLNLRILAALRFLRACIGIMDGFYNQNLIKQNVFEPTIRVLLDTDGRNNLLNSACIEMIEFVRKVSWDNFIKRYGFNNSNRRISNR